MKPTILFLTLLFGVQVMGHAQVDSFEEYVREQRRAQEEFVRAERENFENYRDSLNRQFAEYLAKEWKDFNLQKAGPLLKDPIRKPPVFEGEAPRPTEIPQREPVAPIEPAPSRRPRPIEVPQPVAPAPAPRELYPLKSVFFGTRVGLKRLSAPAVRLAGSGEREVADYWMGLAEAPGSGEWANEVLRLRRDLQLNDWGMVQLAGHLFSAWFPQGNENERVVFSVFILNQLGYRAKIGRSGGELLPLMAFRQMVHNTVYVTNGLENGVKYTVVHPAHKALLTVQICPMDYAGATNSIDMSLGQMPRLAVDVRTRTLQGMSVRYNQNATDFCATYPCVDFSVYAEAALDETLRQSLEGCFVPMIENKSQEEAINVLLHFVQRAFQYKTDPEQFGYEKWFFAEEIVPSAFSDCEDRSILFAQLVRRFLRMPVVLVYYPGQHLATAVRFDDPSTPGDYFTVNGEKYLVCDPTYVNADLGMSMPQFRNVAAEILLLK